MNDSAQSYFIVLQYDITKNCLKHSLGKIVTYELKVPMTGQKKR